MSLNFDMIGSSFNGWKKHTCFHTTVGQIEIVSDLPVQGQDFHWMGRYCYLRLSRAWILWGSELSMFWWSLAFQASFSAHSRQSWRGQSGFGRVPPDDASAENSCRKSRKCRASHQCGFSRGPKTVKNIFWAKYFIDLFNFISIFLINTVSF